MVWIIQFLGDFVKPLMLGVIGLAGLIWFKNTNKLKAEKIVMETSLGATKKVIDVQDKVIQATTRVKATNFSGILERMRGNKL